MVTISIEGRWPGKGSVASYTFNSDYKLSSWPGKNYTGNDSHTSNRKINSLYSERVLVRIGVTVIEVLDHYVGLLMIMQIPTIL